MGDELFLTDGYYLIEIIDGRIVSHDGSHASPAGVAKALELYKRLSIYKPNAEYRMIKVEPVPDVPFEPINDEAAEMMREMVHLARKRGKLP